jgi:uncharacterized protein (TIGR02145 family)
MTKNETLMPCLLCIFLVLLVLLGVSSCAEDTLMERLPVNITMIYPRVTHNEDSTQTTPPELIYGTVADIDSNIYKTVQIGTQIWMAENLKTTRYNDGNLIPYVTDLIEWEQLIEWEKFAVCRQLTTGAYYWYNNNSSNKNIYGAIYNWYAVNTGKLCPTGWHVPTDAEWHTLAYFLGGEKVAGGKLKETGTTHWLNLNAGATNESSFTALPGAVNDGYFGSIDWYLGDYQPGMYGLWWSATDYDFPDGSLEDVAISRSIFNSTSSFNDNGGPKNCGASVRCLQGQSTK